MATTFIITNTVELSAALIAAASGDTLSFAAGDYTGVAIDIPDTRNLTFTSANANVDPSLWRGVVGSEVIIDRIATLGSLTVEGIHVHATIKGPTWIDGAWEAIASASPDGTLTVHNSVVTLDATSEANPEQAFGVVSTYDMHAILVDHVQFGPYDGNFDPTLSNYGVYVNGSNDPTDTVTITNNDFDVDTTRNVGVKLAAQVSGPQVVISGNQFEEPGTALGAIRIDDENHFTGPQDFSGISGNHFTGDGPYISNETG